MSKDSSFSSRGSGNGRKNTFKKSDGPKPYSSDSRPFKKKNYDGRPPAAGESGDGGRQRSSKPYSGRLTDSDKPKRSFGKQSKPGGREDTERKTRREFDKPDFRREDGARGKKDENRPFSERPKRSSKYPETSKNDNKESADRKPRREFNNATQGDGERKQFRDRPKRTFDKPGFKKERDGGKDGFDKEGIREGNPKRDTDSKKPPKDSRPFRDRPKRTFDKPGFTKKNDSNVDESLGSEDAKPKFGDVLDRAFHPPKKKKGDDHPGKRQVFEDKVFGELEEPSAEDRPKRPYENTDGPGKKKHLHDHSGGRKKKYKDEEDEDEDDKEITQKEGPRLEMPLNKFIAHSGECSRRDAADLVRQGKVKVNGELVIDPGHKVKHDDKVTLSGKKLTPQKGLVYILLNKPKGFITTNDDPQGRRTVMELVGNSGVDRLYPVGRLDRDTSGLLLITNDGDLTQKLCHPAFEIKKVYQVTLDKPLTKADFDKITEGLELEDGIIKVDEIAYLEKKNEIGLEIHSGRNRIVRRIFESLGYEVTKLDRVMYAGLTKKNLPRSKWRYLDEREVVLLKHFKS